MIKNKINYSIDSVQAFLTESLLLIFLGVVIPSMICGILMSKPEIIDIANMDIYLTLIIVLSMLMVWYRLGYVFKREINKRKTK